MDVGGVLDPPLNWHTETETYKYLMALTRIFYNNTLLLTLHMKISKHLETFHSCFINSNSI